jgi:hypothetical protein
MTPPKKVVHHGRVKMTATQAMGLSEGLRGLNAPSTAEIEIRMVFERKMEAKVSTDDGTVLGRLECGPVENVRVTPLTPAA